MKFVKIGTHVEGFTESPPENLRELLEAHSLWLEKQKAEGRLLEAYFLPGAPHGLNITVWEFASPEDIDKHFWEDPMSFSFDWEIHPAAEVTEHIKHCLATLT